GGAGSRHLQDLVAPDLGQSRAQRQDARAELPERQAGHVVGGGVPQADSHHVAGLNARGGETPRHLIGTPFKIGTREHLLGPLAGGEHDGRTLRLFRGQAGAAAPERLDARESYGSRPLDLSHSVASASASSWSIAARLFKPARSGVVSLAETAL